MLPPTKPARPGSSEKKWDPPPFTTEEQTRTEDPLLNLCSKKKPRNPLTAYQFFFLIERERILEGEEHRSSLNDPASVSTPKDLLWKLPTIRSRTHSSQRLFRRRQWGRHMGFGELAQSIARRWNQADAETKQVFHEYAALERKLYARELKRWNKHHGATFSSNPVIEAEITLFSSEEFLTVQSETRVLLQDLLRTTQDNEQQEDGDNREEEEIENQE